MTVMMEYDAHQICAVKEVLNGLRDCFEAKRENKHQDEYIREITDILINYVLNTIELHEQLAEIKFERYALNIEKKRAEALIAQSKELEEKVHASNS